MRLRFRTRTLLFTTAVIAISLWIGREWVEWRNWRSVREQLVAFMAEERSDTFQVQLVMVRGRPSFVTNQEVEPSSDGRRIVNNSMFATAAKGKLFIVPPYKWVQSADEAISVWKGLAADQFTFTFAANPAEPAGPQANK